MIPIIRMLCILICVVFCLSDAMAAMLKIGVDSSNWYPYTFIEKGEARGRDVELAKRALTDLGHTFEFQSYPWKRCLAYLKKGHINAIVSGSYKQNRVEFTLYPPGAESDVVSKFRLSHVGYYFVSYSKSPFRYTGDLSNIDGPIAVPLGYSVGKDLEASGVAVRYFSNINLCFNYVLSLKKGAVVTTMENAPAIIKELKVESKIVIHTPPVKEKSYFMIFSRKNPGIPVQKLQDVWDKINERREDVRFYNELLKQYPAQTKYR